MKINVSSDVNAIPERNVNTIGPKDQEKWEIEWEINNLRTEIRKDMRDYQLLYSEDRKGDYHFSHTGEVYWFLLYLGSQINNNLSKLKELVEQYNE